MNFKTISEWLSWLKTRTVKEMDLSLERVMEVGRRLAIQPNNPVITVAGTNGKGSTVAGLETIYRLAGFNVGSFTSPYLFQFNEQVKINGAPVEDHPLCDAFYTVYQASKDIALTQFEMTTLAAFVIFLKNNLDVWILEVGLGGRYDAVNMLAADLAIITTIALDHMEWLGDTREQIALEKCGIFRKKQFAICGDFAPPKSLIDCAKSLEVLLFCQNQQFSFEEQPDSWNWFSKNQILKNLPRPRLALQNMSTVLMALELLQPQLPVQRIHIEDAFKKIELNGRIQILEKEITHILDVSHNPASVAHLAAYLKKNPIAGKTYAVFSMLADKDILASIAEIKDLIDHWFFGPITHERGANLAYLTDVFNKLNILSVSPNETLQKAYASAKASAFLGDRIVIFGSFHTISSVIL